MPRPCVLDASLILSLAEGNCLIVLDGNQRYEWIITPLVRGELLRPSSRNPIDAMIAGGRLQVAEVETQNAAEVALWAKWSARLDPGEAEAIALAVSRGWLVALEDRQAQRALDREVGRGHWINCANVLKDAVVDCRLSASSADAMFRALDCYHAYLKRGILSLSQL